MIFTRKRKRREGIMTENNMDRAIREIDEAESIAIFCHVNPDGDTLGSALALYNGLRMYGKLPYIFCSDEPSEKLSAELPDVVHLNENTDIRADLAIAVDAATRDMLGDSIAIFDRARRHLVIDHHITNTKYGDVNVIDSNASATAEIMFEILEKIHCIDDNIARSLYLAIVTDSGAFSFDSVTSHTHYVASKLIDYDFSASDIIYNLIKKKRKAVFTLTHRVLSKAKFFDDDKIAVVTFRAEDFEATNTNIKSTEGIINNLINIDTVMVAISISETNKSSYKLSIRTKAPIDAAAIASFFGGGGHVRAAGLRIDGFYEDVLDTIVRHATIELGD